METRFYAHQYSYEELCQMKEIELKRLRCDSPEDIEALSQVMIAGKKKNIILPEPKKEVKEETKEVDIDKVKETLAKIKEEALDDKLKIKIGLLEKDFDLKKAQKLIKEIVG
jgi:hypothetical protein